MVKSNLHKHMNKLHILAAALAEPTQTDVTLCKIYIDIHIHIHTCVYIYMRVCVYLYIFFCLLSDKIADLTKIHSECFQTANVADISVRFPWTPVSLFLSLSLFHPCWSPSSLASYSISLHSIQLNQSGI